MHTHIDTKARPPEACPACARLWDILAVVQPYYNLEYELETAAMYKADYGDTEQFEHLTYVRDKALMVKHTMDRGTHEN